MSKRAIFLGGKRGTVAAGGGGGGGGTSPFSEAASSDWELSVGEFSSGLNNPPVADAIVGASATNFKAYGMIWELNIASDATIDTATLVFKTADTIGSTDVDVELYVNSDQAVDSGSPANAAAAVTILDRCGSHWAGSSDLFGGSGATRNTEYTINVKTIIEGIIGRDGWASSNAITLLLSGNAADSGAGCLSTAISLDVTYITPLGGSDDAVLTVVYT